MNENEIVDLRGVVVFDKTGVAQVNIGGSKTIRINAIKDFIPGKRYFVTLDESYKIKTCTIFNSILNQMSIKKIFIGGVITFNGNYGFLSKLKDKFYIEMVNGTAIEITEKESNLLDKTTYAELIKQTNLNLDKQENEFDIYIQKVSVLLMRETEQSECTKPDFQSFAFAMRKEVSLTPLKIRQIIKKKFLKQLLDIYNTSKIPNDFFKIEVIQKYSDFSILFFNSIKQGDSCKNKK